MIQDDEATNTPADTAPGQIAATRIAVVHNPVGENERGQTYEFRLDNPALESMGVRITAWRKDYVELDLLLTSNMLNRSGVIHGGTICALLDAATGYSGLYSPPGMTPLHAVTLSLTSNFLSNGVGNRLSAIGVVERKGRSIYFSRAEVWLDDETLVATGMATLKYLAF